MRKYLRKALVRLINCLILWFKERNLYERKVKRNSKKEFSINEDNYEMYRELLCVEKDIIYENDLNEQLPTLFAGAAVPLIMFGTLCGLYFLTPALGFSEPVQIISSIGIGLGTVFVSFPTSLKLAKNHLRKRFQKKYPGVNISVDADELEKALFRYKELSKVPKNIEEKKEESLAGYPVEVKEMSIQEKIEYFKQ